VQVVEAVAMVTLKSAAELSAMREAGRVVGRTLQRVVEAVRPGVRLATLDELAAEAIREHGARPSFLHYHPRFAPYPFPAVLCLSVNEVVVHGIPNGRALRDGDVLSVDCGAVVDGYHGDAAVTVPVGRVDDLARRLIERTRAALDAGIAAAVVGARIGDVAHVVERVGRAAGYGILADHAGHGIGRAMHEDPTVPNTGRPGRGLPLREGLVLAIEPMFLEGGRDGYRLLTDGWSVATDDGSRAAHWEHSVAVTADGPRVLTLP
jgi:methionyl aminopeptidase